MCSSGFWILVSRLILSRSSLFLSLHSSPPGRHGALSTQLLGTFSSEWAVAFAAQGSSTDLSLGIWQILLSQQLDWCPDVRFCPSSVSLSLYFHRRCNPGKLSKDFSSFPFERGGYPLKPLLWLQCLIPGWRLFVTCPQPRSQISSPLAHFPAQSPGGSYYSPLSHFSYLNYGHASCVWAGLCLFSFLSLFIVAVGLEWGG